MAVRNMKKTLKWKKFELLFHVSTTPSKPQPQSSHSHHLILSSSSFSSVPNLTNTYLKSKPQSSPTLTSEEISKINLLLPRLCLFNHLPTAIQLTTTALTLPNPLPDPKSLSLSILIHSLTLQPDLKLPMSLLTRLSRKHPPHPYLTPISTMLIASYLKKDRPKDALKVYKWMLRPGSPCSCMVDKSAYGILVGGLCARGLVLEGLMVLRDMLRVRLLPGEGLRRKVVRSLLREARVREAKALDELLPCAGDLNKVLDFLDHHIGNWSN
ncbi:hypothetical protein Gotur_013902 [Gossypium turneri]